MKNCKANRKYCGAKGSCFHPPYSIFFNSSCKKHDEGYEKGGVEKDRLWCDCVFFFNLILDTWRIKNKFKRFYFKVWCFLYFLAVRTFGKKHFKYESK